MHRTREERNNPKTVEVESVVASHHLLGIVGGGEMAVCDEYAMSEGGEEKGKYLDHSQQVCVQWKVGPCCSCFFVFFINISFRGASSMLYMTIITRITSSVIYITPVTYI